MESKSFIAAGAKVEIKQTKRVAIIQSCYIPWKGFFDLISRCDEYIIFDSVQFSKRHWHNRNKLLSSRGSEWLSIPVITKSRFLQPINHVQIAAKSWADEHWNFIRSNYAGAPYFDEYGNKIRSWLETSASFDLLSDVNRFFLETLCSELHVKVRILDDRDCYNGDLRKTSRLIEICRQRGASHYLSGPSASVYLDTSLFEEAGILVEWMQYGPYRQYNQLYGRSEDGVSILDALLMLGPKAPSAFETVNRYDQSS